MADLRFSDFNNASSLDNVGYLVGYTGQTNVKIPASSLMSGGSGRKYATLVVGTALMGHTEADVDVLCAGINDAEPIIQALNALPSAGGKLIVREGTYNLEQRITLSRANTTLTGMGPSTVFKRMYNETEGNGLFGITASNCTLSHFTIDGNRSAYTATYNHGIRLTGGSYAKISGLNIRDVQTAIWSSATDTIILDCLFDGLLSRAMYINASGCLISRNTIRSGSTGMQIYSAAAVNNIVSSNSILNCSSGIILSSGATRNTISGNTIMRGTGHPGDYTSDQHTIRLVNATTANNHITSNTILGKDVSDETDDYNVITNNMIE